MAGTSRIQSYFITTTVGEYETFEGNPGNSNDDAVDVAEPAAAEPSTRGPIVQELHLTLDNPTDRVLFQLGTLPSELRQRSMPPKRTVYPKSANGVNKIIQHAMSFTLFRNTRRGKAFGTPYYDL